MSSSLPQAAAPVLSIHLHRYGAVSQPVSVSLQAKQAAYNMADTYGPVVKRVCLMHVKPHGLLSMQPARRASQGLRELFIAPPSHCVACSETFQEEHNHEALIYHGTAPS